MTHPFKDPRSGTKRWIYLSPHFDDAVLSCGGLIWEQARKGATVEIWTIFAGDAPPGDLSPLALRCHQDWGIESPIELVSARRLENQAAAETVGAGTVDFSIPDCIYRRSPQGEVLYPEEVYVPIHASEKNLEAEIADVLASELLPEDIVVSPLAVGGHLDHWITRRSAQLLAQTLVYYADIPYIFVHPEQFPELTDGLEETLFPVTQKGMEAWRAAIACYATQMKLLFDTEENMRMVMGGYWKYKKGCGLWRKKTCK